MSRIGRIASKLRRASGAHFYVEEVDTVETMGRPDDFNAFADPKDRKVKITKKLVATLTDDELAFVIGHEFTHLHHDHNTTIKTKVKRTIDNRIERLDKIDTRMKELGGGFFRRGAALLLYGAAATAGTYISTMEEARRCEADADITALEIMQKAGFNPAASLTALKKLTRGYLYRAGDVGFVETLRATHDAPGDRLRTLEAAVRKLSQKN